MSKANLQEALRNSEQFERLLDGSIERHVELISSIVQNIEDLYWQQLRNEFAQQGYIDTTNRYAYTEACNLSSVVSYSVIGGLIYQLNVLYGGDKSDKLDQSWLTAKRSLYAPDVTSLCTLLLSELRKLKAFVTNAENMDEINVYLESFDIHAIAYEGFMRFGPEFAPAICSFMSISDAVTQAYLDPAIIGSVNADGYIILKNKYNASESDMPTFSANKDSYSYSALKAGDTILFEKLDLSVFTPLVGMRNLEVVDQTNGLKIQRVSESGVKAFPFMELLNIGSDIQIKSAPAKTLGDIFIIRKLAEAQT